MLPLLGAGFVGGAGGAIVTCEGGEMVIVDKGAIVA